MNRGESIRTDWWQGPGVITQLFGERGPAGIHTGVDIGLASGTPITAGAAGKIVSVIHSDTGYGNYVVLQPDGVSRLQVYLAHLSDTVVQPGQHVSAGQLLGHSGSTGLSTGPHLHFEVREDGRPTNPVDYLIASVRSLTQWAAPGSPAAAASEAVNSAAGSAFSRITGIQHVNVRQAAVQAAAVGLVVLGVVVVIVDVSKGRVEQVARAAAA